MLRQVTPGGVLPPCCLRSVVSNLMTFGHAELRELVEEQHPMVPERDEITPDC